MHAGVMIERKLALFSHLLLLRVFFLEVLAILKQRNVSRTKNKQITIIEK
jgi:hypothetical protein